jgi:putative redox protein
MATMIVRYTGDMQTECIETESGVALSTDVPKEVGGKGRGMTPTDLLSASLGSCIATMMVLAAKRLKVDLGIFSVEIDKEMVWKPVSRVSKFTIRIKMPLKLEPSAMQRIEEAARTCPVHNTIDHDIQQEMIFEWGV